jgi:hypothetical protein
VALYLSNFEFLLRKDDLFVPGLIEIGLLVLKKKGFQKISVYLHATLSLLSPLGEGFSLY